MIPYVQLFSVWYQCLVFCYTVHSFKKSVLSVTAQTAVAVLCLAVFPPDVSKSGLCIRFRTDLACMLMTCQFCHASGWGR